MSMHTTPLVRNAVQAVNTSKSLKLSFNHHSNLDLFLIVSNVDSLDHCGKTYAIRRSNESKNAFFDKLYNTLTKNGNISLVKTVTKNNEVFWSKSNFEITSNDIITFTIKDEQLNKVDQNRLNKLLNTLDVLELKNAISDKYLSGYLEERGMTSFNEFINCYM